MIDPYAQLTADEERLSTDVVRRIATSATLQRAKQADAEWRKERAELRRTQQPPPKKPAKPQRRETTQMSVTNRAWDGSESRFTIEEWKRSTLIDTGEGDPNTKARYKLPVKEPNGDLNANAVRNALARFNQVDAPADAKKRAMTKLQALKKQAGIGQDK